MNSSIRRKGEAGSGGGEQQVAATTMALELSSITENTSHKEEGKGENEKKQHKFAAMPV